MGENQALRHNDFSEKVSRSLDDYLQARGFSKDAVQSDESGLKTTVAYRSYEAKIAVYRSIPDGEVNCMIGGPDASSAKVEKPAWQFFTKLLMEAGRITREDLYRWSASPPAGWDKQLEHVLDLLRSNFDAVVPGTKLS